LKISQSAARVGNENGGGNVPDARRQLVLAVNQAFDHGNAVHHEQNSQDNSSGLKNALRHTSPLSVGGHKITKPATAISCTGSDGNPSPVPTGQNTVDGHILSIEAGSNARMRAA
jgi:hypothetical protein